MSWSENLTKHIKEAKLFPENANNLIRLRKMAWDESLTEIAEALIPFYDSV